MPFRCHDLRHRFASTFIQSTGDIPALQAILGHKTISMTMRYAHMVTAHLHLAVAKMGTTPGTTRPEFREATPMATSFPAPKKRKNNVISKSSGGEGGIRTHGTRKGTTVFETAPIGHSGTSP